MLPDGTNETEFVCVIDGRNDYILDEGQCFIGNFYLFLSNINFGLICAGFLIIIVFISLFGGIKEHYRWFILNMAIWDLIITFDYINDHENYYLTSSSGRIYNTNKSIFSYRLRQFIVTNPYSSSLLLSFTRFIALYFMHFYEKLTKKRRVFYLIIIFNILIYIFHLDGVFFQLCDDSLDYLGNSCLSMLKSQNPTNFQICYKYPTDLIYICLKNLELVFHFIFYLKPFVCLSLSIIAAIMICCRLIKHGKFQLKQNRRDFIKSLRIFLVILLQIFINILFFVIEFFYNFPNLMYDIFNVRIAMYENDSCEYDLSLKLPQSCIEIKIPKWLNGTVGLIDPTILQTFRQVRIFMEAIIVLSIMTGYHEAIINLAKFLFIIIKNPRNGYEKFMSNIRQTKVTPY